jgi:hypothetical protein
MYGVAIVEAAARLDRFQRTDHTLYIRGQVHELKS